MAPAVKEVSRVLKALQRRVDVRRRSSREGLKSLLALHHVYIYDILAYSDV